MYKLKKIIIRKMWGKKKVEIDFDEKLNILVGKNGCGKSTVLKILESIIMVDIEKMMSLKFSKVTLILDSNGNKIAIMVNKREQNEISFRNKEQIESSKLLYSFLDEHKQEERYLIINNELLLSKDKFNPVFIKKPIEIIRNKIKTLINLTCLFDRRLEDTYIKNYNLQNETEIDKKLFLLLEELNKYENEINNEIVKEDKKFQEKCLKGLFDFPMIEEIPNWQKKIQEEIENVKNSLNLKNKSVPESFIELYKDSGCFNQEIDCKIRKIAEQIESLIKNEEKIQDTQNVINAIVLTSIMLRNMEILKENFITNEKKDEIKKPLVNLYKLLNKFILDKKITYFNSKLIIEKEDELLSYIDLSSGEKQLLIIFIKTLLEKGKHMLSVTDEPELSLHILWQKEIIEAMMELNPNSQMILSTHSPDIVSKWSKYIIKTEGCVTNED